MTFLVCKHDGVFYSNCKGSLVVFGTTEKPHIGDVEHMENLHIVDHLRLPEVVKSAAGLAFQVRQARPKNKMYA